jgi:RNA-directed DNA polymerase
VELMLLERPEPKGKLDAMTTLTDAVAPAVAAGTGVVNGPEDLDFKWDAVRWRYVEDQVRRLRRRIFTATQDGDLKRVRSLQKLMLRSFANTLVSVRRVTEINAGRLTAGIDRRTVSTSEEKTKLVTRIHHQSEPWRARPVRRVYVPKANGKQRPIGIPVILDRVLQARVVNALEPEWEARFEPKSYGFRPGRGCHDAIEAIFNIACGKNAKRLWVLDADLQAAFDQIAHDQLLRQIGTFPARGLIAQWLTAGVVEQGRFTPTERGTPQGGIASPLLLNVALHGMEQAAGVRYYTGADGNPVEAVRNVPIVVRYADDLLALCHSRDQADQVKARLSTWLAPRGLVFNEDKTRVTPLTQGCDFLGFGVRRYRNGKLIIKPSHAAVKRIRKRIADEMRTLRGANASAVIARLNPIIRGWASYYRTVVSAKVFNALDNYMWKLTYRWALRGHRNKPKTWVVDRYYGAFNTARKDRWVFGDHDSGAYLIKFSWIPIARHQMVKGTASPDDPALTDYWSHRRRRRKPPPLDQSTLRLLKAQGGLCPHCGDYLLHADHEPQTPEEWALWFTATRKALRQQALTLHGSGRGDQHHHLVHIHCHQRHQAETASTQHASAPPASPCGACLGRVR